jgi:hypothetical protein
VSQPYPYTQAYQSMLPSAEQIADELAEKLSPEFRMLHDIRDNIFDMRESMSTLKIQRDDFEHATLPNPPKEGYKLRYQGRRYCYVFLTAPVTVMLVEEPHIGQPIQIPFSNGGFPGWYPLNLPEETILNTPSTYTPFEILVKYTDTVPPELSNNGSLGLYIPFISQAGMTVTTNGALPSATGVYDVRFNREVDIFVTNISFVAGTAPTLTVNYSSSDSTGSTTFLQQYTTGALSAGGSASTAIGPNLSTNKPIGTGFNITWTLGGAPTSCTFNLSVIGR